MLMADTARRGNRGIRGKRQAGQSEEELQAEWLAAYKHNTKPAGTYQSWQTAVITILVSTHCLDTTTAQLLRSGRSEVVRPAPNVYARRATYLTCATPADCWALC